MAAPKNKPNRPSKGIAPTLEDTGTGIETVTKSGRDSSGGKQLLFNVDPEFHREFKAFATDNDLKMKELLEKCFYFYKANHG